ncbi:hypothetical protein FIBSPDRAFT_937696 [Athelia psychrophila]|uniref:F-box domain-containing protein n=1 Tax=Athelia psychrophila TaxID=1759441 RepID=A0A166A0U5_9AGAM|nr:hypothetical protein FIBSPDRAFT_937696 [Fibularhizoctonia sp. CBS 109695]
MATGIKDLANELLYAIFDYLDDQSLSSLSLVSRALHRPALETVIIRLGGNSSMEQGAYFRRSPFALLRAVRSALFIQSLQIVSVTIDAKGNTAFLAELAQLFNRMTHIGSVYICFFSDREPIDSEHVVLKRAHSISLLLPRPYLTILIFDGWDIPDSNSESILLEGGKTSERKTCCTSYAHSSNKA